MLLIILIAVVLIPWMAHNGLPPWWVWSVAGTIAVFDFLIYAAICGPPVHPNRDCR